VNENLIGQQIPTAIIASYAVEWLKTRPWFPFAKINVGWLNRLTAAVVALLTAGAVHYTFGANGDFTLNGNVHTLLHALWASTQQYALQHVVYKMAIAPPAAPVLVQAEPPHAPVTVEEPKAADAKPTEAQEPLWRTIK
jgi:hypothetical protein